MSDNKVVRLTSGLWTKVTQIMSISGTEPRAVIYLPRQYYGTFEGAISENAPVALMYENFGSQFATLKKGVVTRLDFNFE